MTSELVAGHTQRTRVVISANKLPTRATWDQTLTGDLVRHFVREFEYTAGTIEAPPLE